MADMWEKRCSDREGPPRPPPGPGPYVILDNIRSAFNVGAIFRTCEAAAIRRLYLCGISAHPPNPRVLKTSLGTEKTLPWEHILSTEETVRKLRERRIHIVSVELTNRSIPYTLAHYPEEVALVFGHEVAGVSSEILDLSDQVIEIPMLGRKNSLNVATSVGVVLFELVRRRG